MNYIKRGDPNKRGVRRFETRDGEAGPPRLFCYPDYSKSWCSPKDVKSDKWYIIDSNNRIFSVIFAPGPFYH